MAIDIIFLIDNFVKSESSKIIGRQLVRSATSTAANYRADCLSRSGKEFYSKMSIVAEEADETLFWLELTEETNMVKKELLKPLIIESLEIVKIVSKARKNTYMN